MCFFIRVFLFEIVLRHFFGAPVLCFPKKCAFPFLGLGPSSASSWVAFGPVGSGRAALGQGPFFAVFLDRGLGAQNVHLDFAQTQ